MAVILGGSGSFPTIFLHVSQTFVPPQDGKIMIHVIGAGGAGSASLNDGQLAGGAAGGYCRKNSLAVTTSGSFTVTIGAGGAGVVGSASAGQTGGTTSVAGTGLSSTLTSTGGAGGALNNTQFNNAGGGSNGDVNRTGGPGGYRIGGGAIGLTTTGNPGQNAGTYNDSFGGSSDILGDFYSSSLGQLSGSAGGIGFFNSNNASSGADSTTAGPLAGAGGRGIQSVNGSVNAHASIGGGGGFSYSNAVQNLRGGRGGQGCVVIQYIP